MSGQRGARRPVIVVVLAVTAGLLIGVAVAAGWWLLRGDESYPGLASLEGDDPQGAEACRLLAEWRDGKHLDEQGEPENEALISIALADLIGSSTTPEIQDLASDEVAGLAFVNFDELRTACIDAGVDMP